MHTVEWFVPWFSDCWFCADCENVRAGFQMMFMSGRLTMTHQHGFVDCSWTASIFAHIMMWPAGGSDRDCKSLVRQKQCPIGPMLDGGMIDETPTTGITLSLVVEIKFL